MFFNVSSNNLNGSLPTGLGNCKGLRNVDMSNNNIEGALIPELGQLPALQSLVLSDCLLTGALSDTLLSNCQSLRMLDVSYNNMLTGSIPPKLGDCSNLQYLKLQGNSFNETVPADLGRLKNLESLELGSNVLAGILPKSLTNCSALKLLDASNNSLSGGLPAWFSLLTSLQYVALESNQFTGTLPVEITTLPVLRFLDVSNNSLEGNILAEFGNVSTLKFLRLSSNNFNGSIPRELGNISKLQALDLAFNNLTGSIPTSLGNLRDLLWLQLGTNNLTGEIPRELINCSSLIWVNFAHNRLTGQIPAEFGQLGWDSERVFMENRQDSWVVAGLGACTVLTTWAPGKSQQFENMLNLKDSPKCRDWLPFLMNGWFKLTTNHSGYGMVMSYWQLSKNGLTGPIPDLSNITNLGFLILSENHLTGSIPATIGHLPLYNLNISNNELTGVIPKEMGNLSVLIALDLSINNLSGPLPLELENLSYLTMFNVSRNVHLNGSIPNGGQFSTFTWSPYVGDVNLCFNNSNMFENILKQLGSDLSNDLPKLCYGANTTTATSSNVKGHSRAQRIKFIALLSTTCALSTLLAAGTVSCLILNCRRWGDQELDKHHDSVLVADSSGNLTIWMEKGTLRKPVASFGVPSTLGDLSLTYEDLLKATDNFGVENIIGDGGFGIVYKAKLADGRTVAIKKLIQDGPQGEREFLAEMETLGTIQHKNLVPLLGCCSNNEEKLLVYAYLKNGSLDDWLYESDTKAATLDWHCRLHIALGTARGLSFLHHECEQLIIHRDMKSSNILLDENFKAYLTDFGMARILDVNSSHVSTVVAGTPGYVPPEYSQTWRATTKGDVYSFGVVLLELVSGKRPTGPHFTGRCGSNLVEMVRILVGGGRQNEVCDPTVLQTGTTREISELILLGIRCTNALPGLRPSMLEVVCMLEDIISGPLLPTASELSSTDVKIDVYHTGVSKSSTCN